MGAKSCTTLDATIFRDQGSVACARRHMAARRPFGMPCWRALEKHREAGVDWLKIDAAEFSTASDFRVSV